MSGILITGGTGFLGHGLVPQLLEDGCERICIYSRGEHTQARMRAVFNDDTRLRWFIGDVRDRERLTMAMEGIDTVIHAAALKRIEVGAYNPEEMAKTNVDGAINVIAAARTCRVGKVVLISSDKAFEPVSPYGYTKALAESLFLTANTVTPTGPRFAVCRYGNVAGSTGSVIEIWREQMARGDALTITDPEATRFWMSRREAVEFVLEAVEHMHGGEIFIPSLPAFRVGDLAKVLGNGSRIERIGLGKYEKRHEGMDHDHRSDQARRMSMAELKVELATL